MENLCFLKPGVGKLSWLDNEYFRLVLATQPCCCSREVAVNNAYMNACDCVPMKSGKFAGCKLSTPSEALRIRTCLFLHHDLAILTITHSLVTFLV